MDSSAAIRMIRHTASCSYAGSSTERFVRFFACMERGRTNQNELWSYGPEAQKILTSYDELRYRLMPYTYSLAWMVTHDGYTPMRPLAMDFRTDQRALNIGDQFMYGPAILVSPVTEPGATERHLYLPKAKWYDFWTGASQEGGVAINAAAPLDRIPLYVRAGSIVPVGPEIEWAARSRRIRSSCECTAAPMARSLCTKTRTIPTTTKRESTRRFRSSGMRRRQKLTIGERKGTFPGMLANRTFRVVFVKDGHGTGGDTTQQPDKTVQYSGSSVTVTP